MTDETAKELADAMRKLAEAINNLRGGGAAGGFTVYHQHSHRDQMDYRNPYYTSWAGGNRI